MNIQKRIYALIIDLLIISVLITIISNFISLKSYEIGNVILLNREWIVKYSINFIIIVLYYLVFDCFNNGFSFGKKLMNIKIVNHDNSTLSLMDRILRTILKSFLLFSILSPLLLIYFFIKNEVLYDKMMKTKVVIN